MRRDVEGLVVSVGPVDELDGGLRAQTLPLLGVEELVDERVEQRRRQRRHAERTRGAAHEQGWHFARHQYEPARLLNLDEGEQPVDGRHGQLIMDDREPPRQGGSARNVSSPDGIEGARRMTMRELIAAMHVVIPGREPHGNASHYGCRLAESVADRHARHQQRHARQGQSRAPARQKNIGKKNIGVTSQHFTIGLSFGPGLF